MVSRGRVMSHEEEPKINNGTIRLLTTIEYGVCFRRNSRVTVEVAGTERCNVKRMVQSSGETL